MARFAACAEVLMFLIATEAALFVFGPGLAVPPATSLSPPSVCIAQMPVYQGIGKLQVHIVALLTSSVALCGLVKMELAGGGDDALAAMHPLTRRFLRGCMVLALVLSGVSVALGLRAYAYVLEARASVFACLSVSLRSSFFASYVLAGVVCAYVWGRFLWVVVFYE